MLTNSPRAVMSGGRGISRVLGKRGVAGWSERITRTGSGDTEADVTATMKTDGDSVSGSWAGKYGVEGKEMKFSTPDGVKELKEVKEAKVKELEVKVEETKHKTQAALDEEVRLRLEARSGDGGGAGVEYEGGRAVGLKRGVRENMFRVI